MDCRVLLGIRLPPEVHYKYLILSLVPLKSLLKAHASAQILSVCIFKARPPHDLLMYSLHGPTILAHHDHRHVSVTERWKHSFLLLSSVILAGLR